MKQIGLVLQGGGALGAYEFGALERLYDEEGFEPDVVSGVSIGAINAAAVVGSKAKDPRTTLRKIWERFEVISPLTLPDGAERLLALFGNLSFFRMRFDYYNLPFWTSLYDTAPLRETLDEFVSFDKINQSKQVLVLTATNVKTGRVEVFSNQDTSQPITADHVLASGSLPPGFPMTKLNGDVYWDGGLFENTPLTPVIERLDPDPKVEKHLVVVNLFPSKGQIPATMLDVFDRVFEMIFANKLQGDVEMVKKVNEFIEAIEAVDCSLAANSPVRTLPGYKRLLQYKIISRILYITNEDPEVVFGPFDFSRRSIEKRREAGFSDAANALKNWAASSGPVSRRAPRRASHASAGPAAAKNGRGKRRERSAPQRMRGRVALPRM